MSLTGAPKPTFLYPRFKYGTPTITLDIPEPAMAILPQPVPTVGLAGENRVASGKAEIMFGRLEEQCGLVLRCEADMLQALRWMCEDSVFRGNQFQAWIDRYTGSCWMFENTLKDQNGLTLTLGAGSALTYAAASTGTGVVLAGTNYLTTALAQASATTPTGYDDPLEYHEGVLVVDVTPTFNANDATLHFFLDTTPNANNRLALIKTATNIVSLELFDAAGAVKSAAINLTTGGWVSGNRVQLIASWNPAGVTTLAVSINGGAYITTVGTGVGTGLLSALPTTLFIGASNGGITPALGTYDTVAFFKRAFTNPHLTLAGYRPWRRNYFPYGEVLQRQFAPTRVSFARPIDDWPILFRNGQP